MGLFGKILLGINLLVGGGFFWFALQDWQGRQSITASGQRHIILGRDGLPFQSEAPDVLPARVQPGSDGYSDFTAIEIPFEVEGPGGMKSKTVSPELLYKYFEAAGASESAGIGGNIPVASQLAEVKRVYAILKAQEEGARVAFIMPALLRLAETFEERTDYLRATPAQLTHAMDLKFHRVMPALVEAGPLNPDMWNSLDTRIADLKKLRDAAKKAAEDAEAAGNSALAEEKKAEAGAYANRIERSRKLEKEDNKQDVADRRFRLATLLVHLDTRAEWQKRVALVVGIRQYVKAVDGQSGKFKEILDRVEQATVVDQERFIGVYSMLRAMAIQRTQLVIEMAEIRAQLTIQAQKDQDLVNQRQLQLDDLTAQRAAIKAEVNNFLAKQTLTEQALFLIEREIGLKLEDIYRKEAELRKLEIERYEQKK